MTRIIPDTLTLDIPVSFARRGGRREIVLPDGYPPGAAHPDSALLKALARAFRWRRMLEDGTFLTLRDLAEAEKINPSYVSRVLRLTLLAPDIIEAILDGTHPRSLGQDRLFEAIPVCWEEQRAMFA